jgi:hypothetical protein
MLDDVYEIFWDDKPRKALFCFQIERNLADLSLEVLEPPLWARMNLCQWFLVHVPNQSLHIVYVADGRSTTPVRSYAYAREPV